MSCGDCIHYCLCSKISVKNVKPDTEGCRWERSYYGYKETSGDVKLGDGLCESQVKGPVAFSHQSEGDKKVLNWDDKTQTNGNPGSWWKSRSRVGGSQGS